MKKKSTSQPVRRSLSTRHSFSEGGFFNLRVLTACVFCLLGIAVALFAQGNRTNHSLHCRAGRSRHTDTRRHTNGRSCHAQHELARPPLHSQRRGNGGATPDALSASEDGSTTTGDSFLAMVPISA